MMTDRLIGSEDLKANISADVFGRFHEAIYRYILRLVHHSGEAEDLTQETFIRAHNNLSDLHNSDALKSWLYRIATHVCYDRFRQTSYRIEPQSLDEERSGTSQIDELANDPADGTLEQVIDQTEMSACIQAYIDRLSDDYRITILLHDIHGMTCAEISQILGCSLELTKVRLFRARQKLKVILAAGCDIGTGAQGTITCDPKHHSV
jgi:RNA polymerase sigma-70 factor (ECF subfamily)